MKALKNDGSSSEIGLVMREVTAVGGSDITDSFTVVNGTFSTLDEVAPNITFATPQTVSSTFNVAGTIADVGGMGTATAYLVNATENVTVELPLTQTAPDTWTFDSGVTWPVYEPVTIKVSATDAAGNSDMESKMVEVSEIGFSKEEPSGYINAQPDKIRVFTTQMNKSTVTLTLTSPESVDIPLNVTFDGNYAQNTSVPPLVDGTWGVTARGEDNTEIGGVYILEWSFALDREPPVINSFSITDTDGDGYLEAGEVLNFNWDVSGAGAVHLMDNKTHEVFFVSTDLTGTNSTTIDVGNRNMVFAAFDEAGNAAYVPFHLYYNYMAWINSTRIGTVSGIDTNLSAVRQLDLTAQGSVVFYNAREAPCVPIGTVKRSVAGVGQVTNDTYVKVDNTANATYSGADTYDCVWTYNPCSDLDFLVGAPCIDAANLVILEANESYIAQLAHEGKAARDTIDYNNLIQKCAWIFIDGGYTKIKINPDGTFTQPVAEGKSLKVAASGNIVDTFRIADNQVNLTAGYHLSAQVHNGTTLPAITLPVGDYALATISMDGDRIGVITGMPFTVMEAPDVGTVPASVVRGTSFTAAFPSECDCIGAVVIRNATWDGQVEVDACTLGVDSLCVNLTYDGIPATKKLYGNVYASPDAAEYAYARNASSVSVPTDGLLPGTYDVHLAAVCEENGTVKSYGYHQIVVQSPSAPVAAFNADPMSGFAPLTVTFTDASTGQINTWYWEFGDGTTCWNQNPSPHVYNAPGTYQVNLTVWGYGGNSKVSKEIVVISPTPVANFTANPTSGNAPLTVTFTDASTGNINTWAWEFGDGTTCGNQNPSPHIYNAPGTYQVNLTVTGPTGSDTKSTEITVTDVPPAPVANFIASPTSGYAPLTVTLTDRSTGNITSWFWDFGDGTNSTKQNVTTHTFGSVGTYLVNLTVTGPGGSAYKTATITVKKKSSGGGGGGGGGSHTVPPVEPTGPSVPGPSLWSTFSLSGASFSTTDGVQTFSIDLDKAERVKVEGDTVTFSKNGLVFEIKGSDLKKSGNTLTGTVNSLKIKSGLLEGSENVSARFTAEFPYFPVNATIGADLIENVSENVASAYSLALLDEGLDVSEIAYTMKVTKKGIEKCGPATITMTVSPEWVTARGGVDKIRILRMADDGTTQVLETVFKGYDTDGQYVFEAVSPDGLSEIGLVAVTESTAVTVKPTDVGVGAETPTTIPAGGDETPAEGGLPVGLIAVVLVAIVAIAAVGYYFQKKE
ncbi:PKD domain-containing protein [Methanofollis formosanus]|nr:PKD domain-containing protein [Methanofollis formosanus]